MDSYRFTKPASNRRPYKSHMYFVKGVKVDRQIKFFHKLNLLQWVLLEAESNIVGYCERPIEINHENIKNQVVDFWVKRKDREEVLFIQKSANNDTSSLIAEDYAFNTWLSARKIELRIINDSEIQTQATYLNNWQTILHFLASNNKLVGQSLLNDIVTAFHARSEITLQSAIDLFPSEDPVLINTAVFMLLHKGTLKSLELADTRLSPSTKFGLS